MSYPRSFLRVLLASAAIVAGSALIGCDTKTPDISGRHMQPLSEEILAELDARNMAREAPILIRIFKEESELELWKADRSGRFALLRTYPICRWSGNLGPKFQEGDRQAPEGFYSITRDLMNPRSNYHLAINLGFPNAYDRANGRSGSFVMIHGDCASVGCYAVTDEQITEIYSLAREAFFAGHRSFQVQAYPFRMTASTWRGITTHHTWTSGRCSSRATTISRLPERSRGSRCVTCTMCLTRNPRASSTP